jgi:hypothetical protein
MDEHDRDRHPEGRDPEHAERPRPELLVDAARLKQRQPEAGLDHALLRGEAVNPDHLGRVDPAGGEPELDRRRGRLARAARGGRERDPALGGHLAGLHAASPRQGVVRRRDRHQRLLVKRGREEIGMRIRGVPEPERRVAPSDQGADLRAERGVKPQVDPRMGLAKAPEPRGQRRAGQRADRRQRDRPPLPGAQGGHRVEPVAHGSQQRLGVREKDAAGLGEDDAARDPLEQRRAQVALEEADAPADRGLREMEGGRGAREAAAPHDRHERLDVVELHRPSA